MFRNMWRIFWCACIFYQLCMLSRTSSFMTCMTVHNMMYNKSYENVLHSVTTKMSQTCSLSWVQDHILGPKIVRPWCDQGFNHKPRPTCQFHSKTRQPGVSLTTAITTVHSKGKPISTMYGKAFIKYSAHFLY